MDFPSCHDVADDVLARVEPAAEPIVDGDFLSCIDVSDEADFAILQSMIPPVFGVRNTVMIDQTDGGKARPE